MGRPATLTEEDKLAYTKNYNKTYYKKNAASISVKRKKVREGDIDNVRVVEHTRQQKLRAKNKQKKIDITTLSISSFKEVKIVKCYHNVKPYIYTVKGMNEELFLRADFNIRIKKLGVEYDFAYRSVQLPAKDDKMQQYETAYLYYETPVLKPKMMTSADLYRLFSVKEIDKVQDYANIKIAELLETCSEIIETA